MTDSAAKVLKVAYLAGLAACSVLLGAVYAIHNTDPHHWGFILGTALDFMQGRRLFSEVFIQYGAGQPLLLSALSHVMPINYTTIGIIVSAAYALSLVVVFLSVEKVTTTFHAAAITTIAFLVHPYAIYPWPDYLAGLCISLACYFLLAGDRRALWINGAVSGLFLFLAFLLRNTYAVNILLAVAVYVPLALLRPRVRCRQVVVAMVVFTLLTCGYFAFITLQGNLGRWYAQNFGAAAGTYGMGTLNAHGLIVAILYPQDFSSWIYTGLIAGCTAVTCLLIFDRHERSAGVSVPPVGIVTFVALLGVFGMVQGLQYYETFRLQNGGIALYIGFGCFLGLCFPKGADARYRFAVNGSLGALIVVLLANFFSRLEGSNWSISWPIVEPPAEGSQSPYSIADLRDGYASLDIAIFKGHRFRPAATAYYEGLSKYLCDGKSRIVNLTTDSTIPYLCAGQQNALNLPYYSLPMLTRISPEAAEATRKFQFAADELVVSDSTRGAFASPSSIGLEKIGTVERPAMKWLKQGPVSIYRVVPVR